ncbi:MAG TPA: glycosyltransferase family 4 protein [Longimicrobiaceae bacterium]|nr:glycosyltransferase family 4 protein [Longimicrobiaceae bacterium]
MPHPPRQPSASASPPAGPASAPSPVAGAEGREPLRLLYVSHSFPPAGGLLENLGGMQRVAVELHDALAADPGVRLTTRALRTSWAATPYRVGPFLGRMLLELPRIIRRERIGAVLFSSPVTAALTLPLRPWLARRGVRLGVIAYGLDVTATNAAWAGLVRRTFAGMHRVFAISRATAEACRARGATPEQLRIVPCGVDVDRFPPVEDRAAARAELLAGIAGAPVPDGALLLAGVGRHVRRKGFAWFVERVMPRLPEDVVFLLAGEGPETPSIRDAVARHGLQARVRLLGRVSEDELTRLYRGADLFVMPNVAVPGDMEGFGVVILEAGLSGLWTVAAGLEGILDAVTPDQNGELLPSEDEAAFTAAILRHRDDRAALAGLSRRARGHVQAAYGWAGVADAFVRELSDSPDQPGSAASPSSGGSSPASTP